MSKNRDIIRHNSDYDIYTPEFNDGMYFDHDPYLIFRENIFGNITFKCPCHSNIKSFTNSTKSISKARQEFKSHCKSKTHQNWLSNYRIKDAPNLKRISDLENELKLKEQLIKKIKKKYERERTEKKALLKLIYKDEYHDCLT